MREEIRFRITALVCALVLSGGTAWAQPGARVDSQPAGGWSAWLVEVVERVMEVCGPALAGEPLSNVSEKSSTVGAVPPDATANDGGTCEPGLRQGCEIDPDG